MSFQFIHNDTYGREGSTQTKTVIKKNGDRVTTTKKVRSLREILEEQARELEACPHINRPSPPRILYGVPPMEVLAIAEEWAETAKDSRGHKLRKDGNVAIIGVASLPREMEDDFPKFAEDTLVFLKEKYGDRLKSVVIHDDEAHPHLHYSVVPRIGERFEDIHEGIKAKNEAKKNGEKLKGQNLAYISAMREFQDDFYNKVGMKNGLARLGPGRRRLTRGEWNREKAQAKAFANAKAVASSGYRAGVKKGVKEAQEQAQEIINQAQEESKKLGAKVGGWLTGVMDRWHEPSQQAIAEATKAKEDAQKVQDEAANALKQAQKTKEQAKKWADERVATAGNLLTVERTKTKDLESELKKEQDRANDLAKRLALYEKNQLSNGQKFKK